VEPVYGQRFLQAFLQTPRRAGIEVHQFAMQLGQRQLGGVVSDGVGRVELLGHRGLLFIGQVIQHVAARWRPDGSGRLRTAVHGYSTPPPAGWQAEEAALTGTLCVADRPPGVITGRGRHRNAEVSGISRELKLAA